jgi:hypothetical protein
MSPDATLASPALNGAAIDAKEICRLLRVYEIFPDFLMVRGGAVRIERELLEIGFHEYLFFPSTEVLT